ncbi:MAG: hypothetical protein KAU01_05320 [Candidatus Cloacimonetes bacterium]|nr:hypothetical protein [Candidatus Cloacimonadota bacterium]
MPKEFKGIPKLYDNILSLSEGDWTFYEWLDLKSDLQVGQICCAPAWYEKKKRWFFTTANYERKNEANSTWYAHEYSSERSKNKNTDSNVIKYFDLDSTENLIATAGKYRPILLLKYYETDWWSQTYPKNSWLCFPIFEYKQRHNQTYIFEDMKLNNSDRFYIPPQYNSSNPGIELESSILLHSIQFVEQRYIYPLECCLDNKEYKHFKISEKALKLIFFHFMKNTDILNIFLDRKKKENHEENNEYELFKMYIEDFFEDVST